MYSAEDPEWLEGRLKAREERYKQQRQRSRKPGLLIIDASKFSVQLAELATTLALRVEREGHLTLPNLPVSSDVGMILRQLSETYNLLRFINGEQTRLANSAYRPAYSFVCLPLVRTMIDGFYNVTSLLEDPSRSRQFRISGMYRIRESLKSDETRHGADPAWQEFLVKSRERYENAMRVERYTEMDLDNKLNKWPLWGNILGALQIPSTSKCCDG